MRELVHEGKHLRRFKVRPVNKDKRRVTVADRESAKLGGVKLSMGVIANYSINNNQRADFFDFLA